jgi:hypothetical protein
VPLVQKEKKDCFFLTFAMRKYFFMKKHPNGETKILSMKLIFNEPAYIYIETIECATLLVIYGNLVSFMSGLVYTWCAYRYITLLNVCICMQVKHSYEAYKNLQQELVISNLPR